MHGRWKGRRIGGSFTFFQHYSTLHVHTKGFQLLPNVSLAHDGRDLPTETTQLEMIPAKSTGDHAHNEINARA